MNFIEKNFRYVEMDFEEFVKEASGKAPSLESRGDEGSARSDEVQSPDAIIGDTCANISSIRVDDDYEVSYSVVKEFYYLRSLGTDPRRDVSDIAVGFPELAPDFTAPPFVPEDAFFSSVFRIASPGMQVWFVPMK